MHTTRAAVAPAMQNANRHMFGAVLLCKRARNSGARGNNDTFELIAELARLETSSGPAWLVADGGTPKHELLLGFGLLVCMLGFSPLSFFCLPCCSDVFTYFIFWNNAKNIQISVGSPSCLG